MNNLFKQKLHALQQQQEALLQRPNTLTENTNGIVRRYTFPVVTKDHIPLEWQPIRSVSNGSGLTPV